MGAKPPKSERRSRFQAEPFQNTELWHAQDWPVASESPGEFWSAWFHALSAASHSNDPQALRWHAPIPLASGPVYVKGSPLKRGPALRYGWRAFLLRQPYPRQREYRNLLWLRQHLFHAPKPLAVGLQRGRFLARSQWLCTAWLDGFQPWSDDWAKLSEAQQKQRVQLLGAEVARLHALGFVHQDLFPRNLMVLPGEASSPIAFLDAWAGGPGVGRRGPEYDLACLSLCWPEAWSRACQAAFWQAYLKGRAQQGKAVRHPERFLARWSAQRRKRWKREARRGQRYGTDAAKHWDAQGLEARPDPDA